MFPTHPLRARRATGLVDGAFTTKPVVLIAKTGPQVHRCGRRNLRHREKGPGCRAEGRGRIDHQGPCWPRAGGLGEDREECRRPRCRLTPDGASRPARRCRTAGTAVQRHAVLLRRPQAILAAKAGRRLPSRRLSGRPLDERSVSDGNAADRRNLRDLSINIPTSRPRCWSPGVASTRSNVIQAAKLGGRTVATPARRAVLKQDGFAHPLDRQRPGCLRGPTGKSTGQSIWKGLTGGHGANIRPKPPDGPPAKPARRQDRGANRRPAPQGDDPGDDQIARARRDLEGPPPYLRPSPGFS